MQIYNYTNDSHEFTAVSEATESPLEPGVFLIPADATTDVVLEEKSGSMRIYKDSGWAYEALPIPDPILTEWDIEGVSEEVYAAQEYARLRKAEYDELNQFELISDDAINGTSTYKDAILAIKVKYPKGDR